jgi:hypothetical protein
MHEGDEKCGENFRDETTLEDSIKADLGGRKDVWV